MTLDHSGALSRRIEMGLRLPFGVSGGASEPVLVRHRDGNLGRVLEISGLSAGDFLTITRRQELACALGSILQLCKLDLKLVFRPYATGKSGNGMMIVSLSGSSRVLDRGRKARVAVLDERLLKLRRYLDRMAAYTRPLSTQEFLKETRRELAPFIEQEAEPLERAGFLSLPGLETRELDRANMARVGSKFVSTRVFDEAGKAHCDLDKLAEGTSVVVVIQSLENEADYLILSSKRKGKEENRVLQALARTLGEQSRGAVGVSVYLQTCADSRECLDLKKKNLDGESADQYSLRLMNRQVAAWKASLLGSPALPPDSSVFATLQCTDLEELPLLDAVCDLEAGPSPVLLGRGAFWNKEVRFNPFLKGRYRSILAMPASGLGPFAGGNNFQNMMPYTVLSLASGSDPSRNRGGEYGVDFDPLSSGERAVVNPCELPGSFDGGQCPAPDKYKLKFLVNLIEQILSADCLRKGGISSGAIESSIKRAYGRAAKEKRFPRLSELLHYLPEPLPAPLLAEFRAFFEGAAGRCFNGETTLSLMPGRLNRVILPNSLRSQKRLLIELIMIDYASRFKDVAGLVCLVPSIDNLVCYEAGRDLLLNALLNSSGEDIFWGLSMDDSIGSLRRLGAREILSSLGAVLIEPTEMSEELCEILTLTRAEKRALTGGRRVLRTLGSSTVLAYGQADGLSISRSARLSWASISPTVLKRA
ncbi:hypothetical protein GC174_18625 [bacterium]|nr:hypothetical protein [bacterium]